MRLQKIRWKVEDKIYSYIDEVIGKNPYHIPYRKIVIYLSGIIVTASFVIPGLFPFPVGLAIGGFLIKNLGKKSIFLDLR